MFLPRSLFPLAAILGLTLPLLGAAEAAPAEEAAQIPSYVAVLARIVPPTFPDRDFPISSFGAVEGGAVKATEAIRAAIAAAHAAGGGRVVVPPGRWLTGAIHLFSNVELHVSTGATLLFSTDPTDYLPLVLTRWEGMECYNYSALIYAYQQENSAVTGGGILDGQATDELWWPWKGPWKGRFTDGKGPVQKPARDALQVFNQQQTPVAERRFGEGHYLRPNFIQFLECRKVLLEGFTVNRSPMWNLHPVLCENVTIRRVTVDTHGPNNDGCNPESCRDVLIEDCTFSTGDDCIAIKSGRNEDGRRINRPSENIIIRRCVMRDGHGGVVIGSEASGGCRNVWVEDCQMSSPRLERALRLKSNSYCGGTIENVYFRRVAVGEVADAVLRVNYFYEEGAGGAFPPTVRHLILEDVTVEKTRYPFYVVGFPESPVEGIWLRRVQIRQASAAPVMQDAQGIVFDSVTINPAAIDKN